MMQFNLVSKGIKHCVARQNGIKVGNRACGSMCCPIDWAGDGLHCAWELTLWEGRCTVPPLALCVTYICCTAQCFGMAGA
jgi:hypothetical protein